MSWLYLISRFWLFVHQPPYNIEVTVFELENCGMSYHLVTTEDGSLSYLDPVSGELSHNRAGAYSESVQLYVQPSGLLDFAIRQGNIRVLDACYGMGYNSWALVNELLRLESEPQFMAVMSKRQSDEPVRVSLVCIEKSVEVVQFLPRILAQPTFDLLKNKTDPLEHNAYYQTLRCLSDTKKGLDKPHRFTMNVEPFWSFEWELWIDDLRDRVHALEGEFDAIFHDAYSPQKMPELWTQDLFARYYQLLKPCNGRMLTYSAAAAVRGGLIEAGFQIAKTPGLGSKGGGTFAMASLPDGFAGLEALEVWEQEYLHSKAGIPYRDAGLCRSRQEILDLRQREQAGTNRPSGASALKKRPEAQR